MESYIQEVEKIIPLTKEQIDIYIKEYLISKDKKIRNLLLKDNLKTAVKIAFKYKKFHSKLPDLIQEANIGLMHGLDKFKPERNVPLGCYLSFWSKAYILRYLTNNAKIVKIATTKAQRTLFFSLNKEKAKLEAQGKDSSFTALSKLFEMPEDSIRDMVGRLSIWDEIIEPDNNQLSQNEDKSPDSMVEKKLSDDVFTSYLIEFKEELKVKNLFKHIIVFDERLLKDQPETLENIGEREDMQVSKERVRQIETDVKNRLKKFLETEEL